MPRNHVTGIATSNYRQFRLTCTQETSGRVSYSIYAKGLNDSWKEQHCLVRDVIEAPGPILSVEDVVIMLMAVLREQTLPGIG